MTKRGTLQVQPRRRAAGYSAVAIFAAAALLAVGAVAFAQPEPSCPADNGGITLPSGFCATIFADNLGHARHMVVAPNGVLYVNTWSGRYYRNDAPPDGGFLVALKDSKGNGRADVIERFGDGVPQGATGGTGIAFYKGAIYAEQNDKILRYALPPDSAVPTQAPAVVVSDLPLTGDHPMHPFAIDADGHIYVDLGSATNACQKQNRVAGSPGYDPCTELETRAGIWRYDAGKTGQRFSPAERYATGLRNGEGFAFSTPLAGCSLLSTAATSFGRIGGSSTHSNKARNCRPRKSSNSKRAPITAGRNVISMDFRESSCWRRNMVVTVARRSASALRKKPPLLSFRGIGRQTISSSTTARTFRQPIEAGAFIAFHGSWNRAPEPQGGYNVVFQPFKDGKTAGGFVVFADGFAGAVKEPGRADFRPSGLAVGPNGALYISDDKHGRIWRVTYHGPPDAKFAAEPGSSAPAASSRESGPPEGLHPDAGRPDAAALPIPAGATKEQVMLGDRIFHGEAADGACAGCHGSDAKGSPQGPSLVSGTWVFGDGSLRAIAKTINDGVPKPRNYSDPMPPKGGAPLSEADVAAVAAYVWAISHAAGK